MTFPTHIILKPKLFTIMKKYLLTLLAMLVAIVANAAENLWASTQVSASYYYAPGWSQISDPVLKVENGVYFYTLPQATYEAWQAQTFLSTTIATQASKYYDFSAVITSSTDVNATLKLYEKGQNDVFFFSDSKALTAGEPVKIEHLSMKGKSLSSLCLLIDVGGNPENTTITLSDVSFSEGVAPAPTPGFQLTAAPTPIQSTEDYDIYSCYGEHFTWNTPNGHFSNWGGGAPETETITAGDDVTKVENFNYVGYEFGTTTDLTGYTLHVDVLSTSLSQIGITPITQGGENSIKKAINKGEWTTLEIPFAEWTSVKASMDPKYTFQIKWDGGDGQGTLYIDNVFFFKSKSGGENPEPPVANPLTDKGADANGVHKLSGAWNMEQFKAIDAEAKATAYDFTDVSDLGDAIANQNVCVNPNVFFLSPRAGHFQFNEVVKEGDGYRGYNIQMVDHFANTGSHAVNTSIAPIKVVSPLFQRVASRGNIYSTVVLPFVQSTLPSTVKWYGLESVKDESGVTKIVFKEVQTPEAGVPYLAHMDGADIYLAGSGEEKTLTWETTPVTVDGASFVPTFTGAEASDGQYVVEEGEVLAAKKSETVVNAFTSYLTLPSVGTEIQVSIATASGIHQLDGEALPALFDVYTLDGKLVKKDGKSLIGLPSGVYVINGRKVVIK